MASSHTAADSGDDYYALLGVQAGADGEALRVAWRRLAARWHPDRAGAEATARFAQLSAAYTVLSDPIARAAYDRRRGRVAVTAAGGTGAAGSGGATKAGAAHDAARGASESPRGASKSVPGVMLSRLSGPLMILIARGAAHLEEEGFITLVLNEREAAQGGMVMVSMRVELWCPACGGKERAAAAAGGIKCPRCKGERTVQELYSAWLGVPPGVVDGAVLTPSAELPGMVEPARFRVRMRQGRQGG